MRVIGITGGVGAGKSRVLSILSEEHGAEVLQADLIAAGLEEPGQEGYARLVEHFGREILDADGRLDRKAFAARIFRDEDELRAVNEIIHPLTWQEIARRVRASRAPLVVVEAALFNAGTRDICDELWLVDTADEERIRRLMADRGYSREKCLDIMKNQPRREDFLQLADRVIDNGGSVEDTRRQIAQILLKGTKA